MRYLFAVLASRSIDATATNSEMADIDCFNAGLSADGHLVMAAGVASPDRARLFDNRDGRGHMSNGPAVDADLYMAGFWVIDAADEATAHRLAADGSRACNRLIEVRPFLG